MTQALVDITRIYKFPLPRTQGYLWFSNLIRLILQLNEIEKRTIYYALLKNEQDGTPSFVDCFFLNLLFFKFPNIANRFGEFFKKNACCIHYRRSGPAFKTVFLYCCIACIAYYSYYW